MKAHRAPLALAGLLLGLWGCDQAPAPDDAAQAPAVSLPAPARPIAQAHTGWQQISRQPLSEPSESEDVICLSWCLANGCVELCVEESVIAAHPAYAPGAEGCTVCGRETGFLDPPAVEAHIEGDLAILSWIPEADRYAVYLLRWSIEEDGELPESAADLRRASRLARKVLYTEGDSISLALSPADRYLLQVVAVDDEGRWLSAPSAPIEL